MIDTNIRRIIIRMFFAPSVIARSKATKQSHEYPKDKIIYRFAKKLVPKGRGREWNWAMMDVGALLCKARGHSDACPFQTLHGPVGDFAYKKPQGKFAGSDRYYRGRILALLAEATGGVTTNALCRKLAITAKKLSPIISTLRRESLIKISDNKLLLP